MAINFLNSVDFNKNELLNPTIENQPNDTAAGTGVEGQLYFNTTDDILKVYANGAWVEVGGGVTSLTTTDGTYIDLTPNSATTGAVTVTADLSAVDGTAGAGERYLTKSNTWATVASIPGTYTFNVTADGGTPETINSGDTLDIAGGTYITTAVGATDTITINHDSTSRTDTTSTDAPGYGGTFEAVTSVTTNATGHVTAIDVSTVTMPSAENYSWTLNGDSGTPQQITSGNTAFFIGGTNINTSVSSIDNLTINLDDNITLAGTLTVNGTGQSSFAGDIAMGSNSITGLADPTNAQDAATKAYVDNLVDGGLTFKDGFNATTGAIDGGGNLTSGATRVAISVGDYYVVTTAGDFYGDSSYPLTVGDSVIAKEDAAAGASTVTDWVIIQGDEGVVDLTSGNGGTSTGNALTSNTNARGSVTVNSFAYGGTTNVGHVPSGGSATTFLRGDGTWVTPTNTTPNDATITLSAGTNLTGGGDFTTDQATNETITFNLATANALTIGAGNVAAGTGISVSYSSGTATITNTETNSDNSFATTVTGTGTVSYPPSFTATRDVIVQLYDTVTYETVYADVERTSTTQLTITFASTPTNSIRVLVQKIG